MLLGRHHLHIAVLPTFFITISFIYIDAEELKQNVYSEFWQIQVGEGVPTVFFIENLI